MSHELDEPRGRRSPTADELRAWRAFIETSERVKSVVAAQLQAEAELSTGDYAVMLALFEHPSRCLRSSQLADRINWERSRLSHHIGRMERRGLVTRQTAEGDSRGAVVTLTDVGARLFRRASPAHLRVIHSAFVSALSPEQLAAVEDAMLTLQAHLGAHKADADSDAPEGRR